MSIINSQPLIGASGNQGGAYNIERSLRFRSSASAYLNRTPASAGSRTAWTFSFWTKLAGFGTNRTIINVGGLSTNYGLLSFNTNNVIDFQEIAGTGGRLTTTRVFRDPSAWYHIVAVWDTANATAGDRMRVYVNGVRETSFTTQTNPSLSANSFINTAAVHRIGWETSNTAGWQKDGYLSELNFIDGQALTPSSFGETDTITGVWKPKAYTGTYGTNGFYLKFNNITSIATLGNDSSGNSNTWTVNNVSLTAGTTYDSMTDVPTLTSATAANYCVLNPLKTNSAILSNGNLNVAQNTTVYVSSASTFGMTTGKWYWEATVISRNSVLSMGITNSTTTNGFVDGIWTYHHDGTKYVGATNSAYGASFAPNDVIGFAFDADAGSLTCYKNNTSQGVLISGLPSNTYFAYVTSYLVNEAAYNFGQRPFAYTPPSGFVALNTFNLPDSTIVAGNSYMDATTYTGNGSTLTVTNSGSMQPDLVWVKSRSNAGLFHVLEDTVRGTGKTLWSNDTGAETTSGGVSSFNSNGFTLDAYGQSNTNAATYIGWQWKAGGTAVTNTAGTLSAQVSANTSAGFSVATFTAQTSGTGTVGHGLGVAPAFIIAKNRNGTVGWNVYHKSLGGTKYIVLNSTAAEVTSSVIWNNTNPTSTVFSFGSGFANTGTYVAYCWAEIEGFSKFGSYTGNGSTDGPFVYTGFRPKFVLVKCSSASNSWVIWDTSRNLNNQSNLSLRADLSDAELNNTDLSIDALSNGFKLKGPNANSNANGATFIYAAFAENPFKNSLAR